jgi:predicted ribosomally synthesized peptide with SipW-like signal peptide
MTRVWKVLGTVAVVLVVAAGLGGTWSAFTSTSANPGNTFASGTVVLTDDDGGNAMVSLAAAKPGMSDTACIQVTFNGTLPSLVRMSGTTTGTGLDSYIDLTVTRGTLSAPSFDSCATFGADATNYIGAGAGVVYNGTLEAFPDSAAGSILDPRAATAETWTQGESHAYKITVTLRDDNLAQGLTATQNFFWEARNLVSGYLHQLAGTDACVSATGNGGLCASGTALQGPQAIALSPDGTSAYVASYNADAIAVFSRASSGRLTQLAGTNGCVSETGSAGACADGTALNDVNDIVVSPDGRHVYATTATSNAIVAFARNTSTGALTQLAGTAGCVSDDGTSGACTDIGPMVGPGQLVISPDGANVYTIAGTSKAVLAFARNRTTGALTQLAGTNGCVSRAGSGGACATYAQIDTGRGLEISPDGASVYTATSSNSTVAVFSRNASTGVLTASSCVSDTGNGGACTDGTAMNGAYNVRSSPDGLSLYVTSFLTDALTVFSRDPSTGALTQLAGTAGCISDDGTGGACTDAASLSSVGALAVSPDGTNVYVVINGGVAVLARDTTTGALTQAPGSNACVSESGFGGGVCATGVALQNATGLAISPEGESVYVTGWSTNAIAVLDR